MRISLTTESHSPLTQSSAADKMRIEFLEQDGSPLAPLFALDSHHHGVFSGLEFNYGGNSRAISLINREAATDSPGLTFYDPQSNGASVRLASGANGQIPELAMIGRVYSKAGDGGAEAQLFMGIESGGLGGHPLQ